MSAETQPKLTVQVSEDKKAAGVLLVAENGTTVTLRLSLPLLTKLIAALGTARMGMVSGQRVPPLEGQKVEPIFNPRWFVQPELLTDSSLLVFAHPAYGPVAFAVPREQASQMAQVLTAHGQLPRAHHRVPN